MGRKGDEREENCGAKKVKRQAGDLKRGPPGGFSAPVWGTSRPTTPVAEERSLLSL